MSTSTVFDLLRQKPEHGIHTVSPDTTVAYAVCLMNHHGVGAVLVMDEDDKLLGIFTERDVLQRVVEPNRDSGATSVREVMTPNPRTIDGDERIAGVADAMVRGKFRHLPVMAGEEVRGVLSMRDVNGWLIGKLLADDADAMALAKTISAAHARKSGKRRAVAAPRS